MNTYHRSMVWHPSVTSATTLWQKFLLSSRLRPKTVQRSASGCERTTSNLPASVSLNLKDAVESHSWRIMNITLITMYIFLFKNV